MFSRKNAVLEVGVELLDDVAGVVWSMLVMCTCCWSLRFDLWLVMPNSAHGSSLCFFLLGLSYLLLIGDSDEGQKLFTRIRQGGDIALLYSC